MSRSELTITRWLEAHSDRSAGLTTLPKNAVLSDVAGDGDYRLILVDLKLECNVRSRLKVYKGTVLSSDQTLPEMPCGIISFYAENGEGNVPAIGVACGSDLLVYKNNKPFYKFQIPALPIPLVEEEVWRKLKDDGGGHDFQKTIDELKSVLFYTLSPRSQQLLSLEKSQQADFVSRYADKEPVKHTVITCLTTIARNSFEFFAACCPVIGVECGQIYVLDPQSFSILHEAKACHVKASPYILQTSGLFDVEYRMIVVCREGYICLLRKGWLEGKILFQSTKNVVDLLILPGDNFIIMADTEKILYCYTKKGNKLWSVVMKNYITCLCLVSLKHLNTNLIAVGLKGGAIHLYQGRHAVDFINAPDTPSTIIFGQMGQEEHVMVIITLGGTLNFKILKRTADFNMEKTDNMAPVVQSKPLPIPKRSKMFLEQSMRERDNAIEIHQNFQQDLFRLRLTAARTLAQNLSDQSGIGNEKELIKLSAQVLGLGPKFTLILTLENMNNDKPLVALTVLFHCKTDCYTLSSYACKVPLIPPSLSYKIQTCVLEKKYENGLDANRELSNLGEVQVIRVFVVKQDQSQPALSATINMPPTDITAPILD